MTPMQIEALRYVKNTGGNATYNHFIDDHEPIGQRLWQDLKYDNVVSIDDQGKIFVTKTGEKFLKFYENF